MRILGRGESDTTISSIRSAGIARTPSSMWKPAPTLWQRFSGYGALVVAFVGVVATALSMSSPNEGQPALARAGVAASTQLVAAQALRAPSDATSAAPAMSSVPQPVSAQPVVKAPSPKPAPAKPRQRKPRPSNLFNSPRAW